MTYLGSAANSMYLLLDKTPPRPEDLIQAASIGCKILNDLSDDPEFKEHVRRLLSRSLTEDFDGRNWNAGLLKEFPIFLGEVRKLLVNQQLSPGLINMLCRQAEQLRLPMSEWRGGFDDFLGLIEQVRHDICKLQKDIEENRTNPAFLNEARTKLLGFTYMIAGLTCIFITAVLLYPDLRTFILALTSILGSTYLSLAAQPPQIASNIPNQQARHLFRKRVAIPVISSVFLILITILVIHFSFISPSRPTPTPTARAPLDSKPLFFGNIKASFYTSSNTLNGTFDTTSSSVPIFTQSFPIIAFNPNPSMQHCSKNTGVNTRTRPFTDIFQNPDGSCKTIRAQDGHGHAAGLEGLYSFNAVFLTSFVVISKGLLTMQISGDDGWIIAIGGNRGKVPSPKQTNSMTHPAVGHKSPIYKYSEMGDNNLASAPALFKIEVEFPDAGTYPVEIDYTECCGHELTLVISNTFTSE